MQSREKSGGKGVTRAGAFNAGRVKNAHLPKFFAIKNKRAGFAVGNHYDLRPELVQGQKIAANVMLGADNIGRFFFIDKKRRANFQDFFHIGESGAQLERSRIVSQFYFIIPHPFDQLLIQVGVVRGHGSIVGPFGLRLHRQIIIAFSVIDKNSTFALEIDHD